MARALFVAALLSLPVAAAAQSSAGAFWRSLLVPGWGQRYAGGGGGRFVAAEVFFWGAYLGLEQLGGARGERFRSYAAEHAGARPHGKGDEYLDDLGFYESRLQHNQFALREEGPRARLYPPGAEFFWEWDGEESRRRYRQLRNGSENAKRQALYMTGLVVANHLLSAVHAARSLSQGAGNTRALLVPVERGAQVLVTRRF